ncbi:phosphoglycerate mutase-like protein 1 [Gossypium australe]|uniref:Phosphoglycerate mutase-like protein 1 n=1 Tax=Gossypium australe TaxID=47621 RepID=A0A5B6VBJ4_9ROSI|nr:phosphoglycerate mutase-like protein 1 [Gossypium australe]
MEAIAALHLGRSKRLHLLCVRHAQGRHNLEAEKSRDPLTSFEYFDAELSSLGWQQVYDKRKHVCSSGLLERVEVVISSPMSRTLQTAVGIFHGEDETSFEVAKVKSEDETSSITFNPPPIIAYELCRERLVENEDDILWKAGEIETHEEVGARAMKFFQW